MNRIVKRFFVLALPLLMTGAVAEETYSIQVENNAGIQFDEVLVNSDERTLSFGQVDDGESKGIGHADLHFGDKNPKSLELAFRPKNDDRVFSETIELPDLQNGEAIKLSINSYLDLIRFGNLDS